MDNQPFEDFTDILDKCIERMLEGETMEQVLASYPRYSASLAPVLRSAGVLLSASAPAAFAVQRSRAEARMLAEVAAAPSTIVRGGTIMSWLASFKARPAMFQAGALAAGVIMFGAAGIGGAAATGNTPEPVRNLFSSSSPAFNVEFTGVIMAVNGGEYSVEVGGATRTFVLADNADVRFDDHDDDGTTAGLSVGAVVKVRGTLLPDNTILASRVRVEDADDRDDDGNKTATATASSVASSTAPAATATTAPPVVVPTIDDDDDCDNSGPGSPCDDDDERNDDDGEENDDNSGRGNGDDDGDNNDNSGPGNGDDGGDDSGAGDDDDDDEDDDDSSGSRGDDDDDGDDD